MVNGNAENVLQRSVLLSVAKAPSDYTVDLTAMKLVLSGDILISLELLRSSAPTPDSRAVFFPAALLHSATWRRQTSQAPWKKAHGIGVGFNIEVR